MKPYLFILLSLIVIVSCKKNKKENCEFHRIEYVVLKEKGGDLTDDQTILECLQLEVNNGIMQIANKTKTISIQFSISGENIIEDIDIRLDGKVTKKIDATDEQEMELIKKAKSWEINIESDNKSNFNGHIKLYKTSDGDYWKKENAGDIAS